jgi:hypothetical protein
VDNELKDLASGYWAWLGDVLKLTTGGRIGFTIVAIIGGGTAGAGAVADALLNGQQGPQEGAVLGILVGVVVVLALGAVVALDLAFRGVRSVTRRLGPGQAA